MTDALLPSDWQSDQSGIEFARHQGMTDKIVDEQIASFKAYNHSQGRRSPDWGSYWKRWCIKWKERASPAAKAPPSVSVNSAPDWDNYCRMWVRLQRWPRRDAGGEPGMLSCICPKDVLIKHGIDPDTGYIIRAEPSTGLGPK